MATVTGFADPPRWLPVFTPDPHPDTVATLADLADRGGLRTVHMLAWRDLDDPEAGGSEVHASNVAAYWARAGIEVTMRTSFAAGHPPEGFRDGYRVIRKAGRYLVFPRTVASELFGRNGRPDGLVEIWNGMPFLSPLWRRGPRSVWLHHVHGPMWTQTLGDRLGRLGMLFEERLTPPFYRKVEMVTLSGSAKRELVDDLGFAAERVRVVEPGIDPRFTPGGRRSDTPLVVAVGRLVPVKQFHLLIEAAVRTRERVPDLEVRIVGEGYERRDLEALVHRHGADSWLRLPGRVSDEALTDLYRSAWAVASTSLREGWGMTLTEAAGCGTPGVATRIAGHADAIVDGVSGLLADGTEDFADQLTRLLTDTALRSRLSDGALRRAETLTWDNTAIGTLEALVADATGRCGRGSRQR